ncbi:MAG: FAD-dependent oxidoreductase, partial [Candidatus Binatia bacterium]
GNITPLLHSFICGVVRSGDDIEAVVLATKKGLRAVRGRVFVDATGDADVVYHAGCPWEMGETGRLQYPSMQFFVQNVDMQKAFAELRTLADKIHDAYEKQTYALTRAAGAVIPTMREGEAVGAMTRVAKPSGDVPDGTDVFDLTEAEMRGRAIVEEASRFLKEEIPGFGSAFLQDTATTLGVRETRHALGDHVLTFEEAAACAKFPDGIACSAWPFEFHTEGPDTRWDFLPAGDWFEIPFRSLVARDVSNLLVAGRCISATHEALASSRVTGVCMAIGEAAGTAAATAVAEGRAPRVLDGSKLRADLEARSVLPRRS